MGHIPRSTFRELLAGLDDGELVAFVAAVYDARGWETERVDGGVLVTPPGESAPRRIAVGDETADRVVAPGAERESIDGRVLDADDLLELVRYAVPAEATAALFDRFFDRDVAEFDVPPDTERDSTDDGRERPRERSVAAAPSDTLARPSATERPPRRTRAVSVDATSQPTNHGGDEERESRHDDDHRTWSSTLRLLGAGLALVLVGGAVVTTGGGLVPPDGGETGGSAITATATPTAGAASSDGGAGDASPASAGDGSAATPEDSLPPGVDEGGIANAERIAAAHRTALSGRSYRLRITRREYENDVLRGVAHERVSVVSTDRYHSRVWRLGAVEAESFLIAPGGSYANGSIQYRRAVVKNRTGSVTENSVILASRPSVSDRFAGRTSQAIRWFLDVEQSSIVETVERDGTDLVRIRFTGGTWPPATNVTGQAVIDERGVVRMLRREYEPQSNPSDRIVTTIRIEPTTVTVTRPEWAPENGSTADTPEPTATDLDGRPPTVPLSEGDRVPAAGTAAVGPNV
jgi:hypothetical protein